MFDIQAAVIDLLRVDPITPWFDRNDLAFIVFDDLGPDVPLVAVDSAIDDLLGSRRLRRREHHGSLEVALAE